jgi:hypothetical protein
MSETFERQLKLPVTAEEAFAWHERPGALDRLIPPWENVEVADKGDGIRDGSTVKIKQRFGPLKLEWVAKHSDYYAGRSFRDTQISGPFASWEHLHDFASSSDGHGLLTDHIEYKIPAGVVGRVFGGPAIKRKLESMFTYRHNTTQEDLAVHAKYKDQGTMNIAVSGSGGLV